MYPAAKKKCRLVDFINFIKQNFHIQFQISSWPVCRERSGWNKNLRIEKVQTGPSNGQTRAFFAHVWPSVIINFIENNLWVVCWSLLLTPGHFPSSRDLRCIKVWEGFWLHVASKHTLCNDDSKRHASPISANHYSMSLEIVPNTPLTTGTTVVSRNFQMHLNSRFRSWCQFLHFLFLSECLSQLGSGARVSIGQKTSYQTLSSWLSSKRAHPPGHLWGICHLVSPGRGKFQ